jgi:hypothetical protein
MHYTSGNKAPTLMAQMPNKVGNKSKFVATGKGGATAETRPEGSVMHGEGYEVKKKPKGSPEAGRGQKVTKMHAKGTDGPATNNGFLGSEDKRVRGTFKRK